MQSSYRLTKLLLSNLSLFSNMFSSIRVFLCSYTFSTFNLWLINYHCGKYEYSLMRKASVRGLRMECLLSMPFFRFIKHSLLVKRLSKGYLGIMQNMTCSISRHRKTYIQNLFHSRLFTKVFLVVLVLLYYFSASRLKWVILNDLSAVTALFQFIPYSSPKPVLSSRSWSRKTR